MLDLKVRGAEAEGAAEWYRFYLACTDPKFSSRKEMTKKMEECHVLGRFRES